MVLTVVVRVTGVHPEPRAPVREGSLLDKLAPGLSPSSSCEVATRGRGRAFQKEQRSVEHFEAGKQNLIFVLSNGKEKQTFFDQRSNVITLTF